MIEYRHSFPEERETVIATANRVFGDAGADINFETAIPKVYGAEQETSDLQYIAVDENRKIHALIARLPNRIHVGAEILKCGCIGTVSVIPESRGRGHMKELMRLWEQEMRAEGTDLAILGGQRQRYQYFGYVPGAPQYTFTISWRRPFMPWRRIPGRKAGQRRCRNPCRTGWSGLYLSAGAARTGISHGCF